MVSQGSSDLSYCTDEVFTQDIDYQQIIFGTQIVRMIQVSTNFSVFIRQTCIIRVLITSPPIDQRKLL